MFSRPRAAARSLGNRLSTGLNAVYHASRLDHLYQSTRKTFSSAIHPLPSEEPQTADAATNDTHGRFYHRLSRKRRKHSHPISKDARTTSDPPSFTVTTPSQSLQISTIPADSRDLIPAQGTHEDEDHKEYEDNGCEENCSEPAFIKEGELTTVATGQSGVMQSHHDPMEFIRRNLNDSSFPTELRDIIFTYLVHCPFQEDVDEMEMMLTSNSQYLPVFADPTPRLMAEVLMKIRWNSDYRYKLVCQAVAETQLLLMQGELDTFLDTERRVLRLEAQNFLPPNLQALEFLRPRENSTYNPADAVRRVALADTMDAALAGDINVALAHNLKQGYLLHTLFSRCQRITEIAAPSRTISALLRQTSRATAGWENQPSPIARATTGAPLGLVIIEGELPDACSYFESNDPSDETASQRVSSIFLGQWGSYSTIVRNDFSRLFSTFSSLTHLAVRLPALARVSPFELVTTSLSSCLQLERIVFLGSGSNIYMLSSPGLGDFTEEAYKREILLAHAFRDRRILYLPDVPLCEYVQEDAEEYVQEDDPFISWWSQQEDVWEAAERTTATDAIALIRGTLEPELNVHNLDELDALTRHLNGPNTVSTLQTPLRVEKDDTGVLLTEVLQTLSIDPHVKVRSTLGHKAEQLVNRLGANLEEMRLSYAWFDEIFCSDDYFSSSNAGKPLKVTIMDSTEECSGAWPARLTASTFRVTHLLLPSGLQFGNSSISHKWAHLPSLTHLALPVPENEEELDALAERLIDGRIASILKIRCLVLFAYQSLHGVPAQFIEDLDHHGIEVRIRGLDSRESFWQ